MARKLDQPVEHSMSFGDHLEELRRRLLSALIFPIPASIILYFFSPTLIQWLLLPLWEVLRANNLPPKLINLTPQEMMLTRLKLSFIFGLIISAPWVLWQAWRFIAPGLYQHERRFVHLLIPGSIILTIAGAALMYYVMLPLTLSVLVSVSIVDFRLPAEAEDLRVRDALAVSRQFTIVAQPPESPRPGEAFIIWPDFPRALIAVAADHGTVELLPVPLPSQGIVAQEYRVSETLSFVLLMFLGTVIVFHMPLVVVLLGWLGLASTQWLRAQRKYALFICAVIAAIVTPSADIISMLIMMIPLYALYELGIVLLVLAPASAVAEGRVLSLRTMRQKRRDRQANSDKQREPMDRPNQTDSSERTVPRNRSGEKTSAQDADGGEDGAP